MITPEGREGQRPERIQVVALANGSTISFAYRLGGEPEDLSPVRMLYKLSPESSVPVDVTCNLPIKIVQNLETVAEDYKAGRLQCSMLSSFPLRSHVEATEAFFLYHRTMQANTMLNGFVTAEDAPASAFSLAEMIEEDGQAQREDLLEKLLEKNVGRHLTSALLQSDNNSMIALGLSLAGDVRIGREVQVDLVHLLREKGAHSLTGRSAYKLFGKFSN